MERDPVEVPESEEIDPGLDPIDPLERDPEEGETTGPRPGRQPNPAGVARV